MSRVERLAEGIELHLGDARDVLPTLGRFDAAVMDPAYGINAARDRKSQKHGWRDYDAPGWDAERTPADLVCAAVASAKYAIVWGGNYWSDVLPPTSKWLSWDKGQTDFSLADFELAWCSFDGAARRITVHRAVALQDGKEHPTQKPLGVMKWCLQQLPADARSIIDPFMGSGTTGVACAHLGREFTGIEREQKYFEVACRRISDALKQPDLFIDPPAKAVQEAMEI